MTMYNDLYSYIVYCIWTTAAAAAAAAKQLAAILLLLLLLTTNYSIPTCAEFALSRTF